MAVARLVSLFESKILDRPSSTPQPDSNSNSNTNINSFASRSLRLSPTMSSEDTFCLSIQPHHFSSKRASRQRYYAASSSSSNSSPDSSPSSSYRSNRFSFRSMYPICFSSPSSPTRRRFSQHLGLRRIPSHIDLALAAERNEQGLDLLEPRPVAALEAACLGRSASPPVVLENIFELLEGH